MDDRVRPATMTHGAWRPDSGVAAAARLIVARKSMLAEGVCSIRLVDEHSRRLPDWSPGAHIDLTVPGHGPRQYSLCGDRWDPFGYEIAVLKEPAGRGGSRYVHEQLVVGDGIEVGGPRNHFFLAPADRYLFIAGGIGITPVMTMVENAEVMGVDWTLLYGGRSRRSMAFVDRLERFGDRVQLHPQDESGLMPLASVIALQPPGTKIYCCGPGPLLDAVTTLCDSLPPGALRIERFVAQKQVAPTRSATFEVELARSGRVLTVEPNVSVLDTMADAGVPVLASCRQGTCGTCETGIIAGMPEHRDSILNDDERMRGESFYPCVSRAVSDRLVLDA